MNASETLTRKELYDLVWSLPLTNLSKKYNLSDNGLRKICIRMQIPLPTAGHWMRLKFNKNLIVPSLRHDYTGDKSVTLPLRPENEPATPPDPAKALAIALRNDKTLSFEVPDRLHTKNPLILAIKERLAGKNNYAVAGVVNSHRDELDIKVGVENLSRLLRFADILISLLTKRGHNVIVTSMDTFAIVNGQQLKISFRERLKKHVVKGQYYDSTELHPTGWLYFKLDGFYGKEWKDGKEKLEYYLPDIIAYLETESIRRNERDEERKKEKLEWERQEQLKKDLAARKQKDLAEFNNMLEQAERWHSAQHLRNYIDVAESRGLKSPEWLSWARAKADWYDPFVAKEDELFGLYNL